MLGIIKALRLDRGFGFIQAVGDDPNDYFFHSREVTGGSDVFGTLRVGDDVEFQADQQYAKGPRAFGVMKV